MKTTVIFSNETRMKVSILTTLLNSDMKNVVSAGIDLLYEYIKVYKLPPELAESLDTIVAASKKLDLDIEGVVEEAKKNITAGELKDLGTKVLANK